MSVSRCAITMALLVSSPFTWAATYSTADLSTATAEATSDCIDWKIIGQCLWLRCGIDGCSIKRSTKYQHYRPDLVVNVYRHPSRHPWQEMRALSAELRSRALQTVLSTVSAGQTGGSTDSVRSRLQFFEADVVGHPITDLVTLIPGNQLCESQTDSLDVYFDSVLDAIAWRFAVTESISAEATIPGRRELGTWPHHTWGSVYPRCGWVTHPHMGKAAALIAQRAGDIVTRRSQLHVYQELPSTSENLWAPAPLHEGSESTGKWQMVSPTVESRCGLFGRDDRSWNSDSSAVASDADQSFAWNLWRRYECCARRGQWFLGDVEWN